MHSRIGTDALSHRAANAPSHWRRTGWIVLGKAHGSRQTLNRALRSTKRLVVRIVEVPIYFTHADLQRRYDCSHTWVQRQIRKNHFPGRSNSAMGVNTSTRRSVPPHAPRSTGARHD